MNTEEHDDLWQLLGRNKTTTVSPFFSRNVMREVRALSQDRPGVLAWLRAHWKAPALALCTVAIAAGAILHQQRDAISEDHQLLAMAQTVSESPDYLVIGHLDELLDGDDDSVWLTADTN